MLYKKTKDKKIVVPPFSSAQQVKESYQQRRDIRGFEEGHCRRDSDGRIVDMPNLYPRDGFTTLVQLERNLSKLIGATEDSLLAYPSGMSAIVAAIESAHPTKGMTIMLGQDHYTEIPRYIDDHLRPRGVKVVRVNSGDSQEIRKSIARNRPDIILFETVANGTTMPVLDVEALFKSIGQIQDMDPLLILDSTLSTPTTTPPSFLFGDNLVRVAVVESGTKSYAMNSEMLGILYTNDNELWTRLFSARITVGYTPAPSAVDVIVSELPDSKEQFDERNRTLLRNTLALAQACMKATWENPKLVVIHPNLPTHPNYLIAQKMNPNGVTPVFYINNKTDQFVLTDLLLEDPVISKYCRISQSFGFDQTRVYPYYGNTFVRFAGGAETNAEISELSQALYERLRRA